MFEAAKNKYMVPFDGSFRLGEMPSSPPDFQKDKKILKKELKASVKKISGLQDILYAHNRYAVLLIFQAMDAAGKDGTIRRVMSGVNPAGCQVYAFKQPSAEELDHDFLWRTTRCLPERGRIGIFNRSYYEEVLVVRVHPEYLKSQRLPGSTDSVTFWATRLESIKHHEAHLAANGTVILKFWLNVSKEEQRQRFISRLDEPQKNWKFSVGDISEREFWEDYMAAYEEALAKTSKPWAPWYAIPADNKAYMRLTVAKIIVENLQRLSLGYPKISLQDRKNFETMRSKLATG